VSFSDFRDVRTLARPSEGLPAFTKAKPDVDRDEDFLDPYEAAQLNTNGLWVITLHSIAQCVARCDLSASAKWGASMVGDKDTDDPGAMMKIERFVREAVDAIRAVRRTPDTALTAAMLIALVVGGNITIFSVVYAILTKPARGVHAERLVTLESRLRTGPSGPAHTYPEYHYYATSSKTLRSLAGERFAHFTISLPDASYARQGGLVSTHYFDTLGVRAARGRLFAEEDDRLVEGLVAVISYRFWQDQLGGSDSALGTSILIDGNGATIIGVAEADFRGAWLAE
jgi:hypothetical protein